MSETHRLRLVENHTWLTFLWFCKYITFLHYSPLNWPSDFVFDGSSCQKFSRTFCKPITQTYSTSPLNVTHDYRSTFLHIQFPIQTTKHQKTVTYCHRKLLVTELCNNRYCNWGYHDNDYMQLPNMENLRFSQRCCWRFKSSVMWCCVVAEQVVPDVSKHCSAFIFRVKINISNYSPKTEHHIPEDLNLHLPYTSQYHKIS